MTNNAQNYFDLSDLSDRGIKILLDNAAEAADALESVDPTGANCAPVDAHMAATDVIGDHDPRLNWRKNPYV